MMEEKLKQISKEDVIKLLQNNKVELRSTHDKLCLPIINRLYKKMSIGIKFSAIKVEDDLILDGHHRYLASLLANYQLERVPSNKTAATVVTDWSSVDFVDEDWDTEAKIKMLNEQDAKYNNVSLEKIDGLMQ